MLPVEQTSQCPEREIRAVALGRKSWLFAGSDRGGERAAVMLTLIHTALCRARHKAVYADPRAMPSAAVFPMIHRGVSVRDSA
jgi:transposase